VGDHSVSKKKSVLHSKALNYNLKGSGLEQFNFDKAERPEPGFACKSPCPHG